MTAKVSVITASAGSGKTYTLTQRLYERLAGTKGLDPALRANQVIATTFTVRAAADLIDKTQKKLLDEGCINAAQEIGTALIGTVNSVAGRVVTEYAIDAGYSPQLRVIDENEQAAIFATAVDVVVAQAEAKHRSLLARTSHNGQAENTVSGGSAPVPWATLVKKVAEAARANHLSAEDLQRAAEDSVRASVNAMGGSHDAAAGDRRQKWFEQLAADTEDLREALELHRQGHESQVGPDGLKVNGRNAGNIEGSIITLEAFLRDLVSQRSDDGTYPNTPWSTWAKIAQSKFPPPAGGAKLGKVPLAVLESSSVRLVEEELLASRELREDLRDVTHLIIDTAVASIEAYAEYKDRLGVMDFVDQEVRALDLLRSNFRVRASVASRFRLLAVDEFQDSSPLQLALFMELAELVSEVIWVGDRKQAIYGFRGADPELMEDVFSALEEGRTSLGAAHSEVLGHSWRSSDPPLELSNAIFSSVFHNQAVERVTLSIPPQRANERGEGSRELWVPASDKGGAPRAGTRMAVTIAQGLADFLSSPRGEGCPLRDIAVLVRTNSQVDRVVTELQNRGIPAVGSTIDLLSTREAQVVIAGLAAVVDPSNTRALAELVTLLSDHGSHETWFSDAVRIVDVHARQAHALTWWDDEVLNSLKVVAGKAAQHSAVDLLLAVVDALDLPLRIKEWSHPEKRLGTLDGLRRIAAEYGDECGNERLAVTPSGLLAHLLEAAKEVEQTSAHDEVIVMTMHQSKGLQWPVVVVGMPLRTEHWPATVHVKKAQDFDVRDPLRGRSLLVLPQVLGNYSPFEQCLRKIPEVAHSDQAAREETARLLYVALTRAERCTVMAFSDPQGENNLLSAATDADLLKWENPESVDAVGNAVDEGGVLKIKDLRHDAPQGEARFSELRTRISVYAAPNGSEESTPDRRAAAQSFFAHTDVPLRRPEPSRTGVAARFTASSVSSEGTHVAVQQIADLGPALVDKGGHDWDVVGEAIHHYLALPLQTMPAASASEAADRIIRRWSPEGVLTAGILRELGARWTCWIEQTFPGATLLTEQPIAWRNEANQTMQGWIDAHIVLPDAPHILVDHKSFPGADPEAHLAQKYAGQLSTYSRALAAGGSGPSRVLLHLPLQGAVMEVTGAGGAQS